jgi:hypothetical protein
VVKVVKSLPNKAIGNEFKAQYLLKKKREMSSSFLALRIRF